MKNQLFYPKPRKTGNNAQTKKEKTTWEST